MPEQTSGLKFIVDSAGATRAIEEQISILADFEAKVAQVTQELVKYNNTSNTSLIIQRGFLTTGQKFVGTVREEEGVLKVLNTQLDAHVSKTKEEVAAQKELDVQLKELERTRRREVALFERQLKQRTAEAAREEKKALAERAKDQLAAEAAQARTFRDIQAKQVIPGALQGIGFDASKLNTGQIQAARIAINNLNNSFVSGRVNAQDLAVAIQHVNTGSVLPLSGGAAIAAGQIGNLNSIMQQTNQTINISAASLIKLALVFGFRQLLIGLINEFKALTVEAFNFDKAITQLKVTSDNVHLERLKNELGALSREFGVNRLDLVKAQIEIYKNSVGAAADNTKILTDAIRLGEETFVSTSEAAKTLSETIRIFGLNLNDSKDVADKLFVGTRIGRADLKEIDNLFERVGATAKQLGISFEEVLAAFATLRKGGTSASEATSELNNIFGKLREGTPELNKLLADAGFQSGEQAIQTLKLKGVLDLLATSADKGRDSFTELGKGLRFFKGESGLALGADTFEKFIKDLDKAGEAAEKAGKIIDESLSKRTEIGLQKIKSVGAALGDEFIATAASLANLLIRNEELSRRATENAKKNIEALNNGVAGTSRKTLTDIEKIYLDFFTKVDQGFNSQLKKITASQQQIHDLFKIAGEGTIDTIKGGISEINKEISEAQAAIKTSQKSIFDDASKFEKESFDRRLKLLTPQEQFRPIDQRISQLTGQGTQLFGGDAESIRQGRERFNEALGFLLKEEELNNQLARTKSRQASEVERFQEAANLALSRAFDQETKRSSASSARLREEEVHQRNLENIGKSRAARDAEQIRHGQQLVAIRDTGGDRAAQINEALNLRIAGIQREINNFIALRGPFLAANAAQELRGLQILSQKLGLEQQAQENLKKQVEDNKAIKAAEEDRLRRIGQLFAELNKPVFDEQTGKLKKGFQSAEQAAQSFKEKQDELNKLLTSEDIAKNPNLIIEFERLKQSRLTEIDVRAKQEALARERKFVIDVIATRGEAIKRQEATVQDNLKSAKQNAEDISNITGKSTSTFFQSGKKRLDFERQVEGIQKQLATGAVGPEDIEKLKNLFNQLPDLKGIFVGDELKRVQAAVQNLGTSLNVLDQNLKLKTLSDESLPALNARLRELGASIDVNKFLTLSQGADSAANATQRLAEAMIGAADKINAIVIAGQQGAAKADGGLITRGTGPRSDDVPIWASRGEYIINAASTRKFYSQLQAINADRFASGGLVGGNTTNVGDIHINVQGGDTAEVTLRNIGNGLQRMARRGLFRVH